VTPVTFRERAKLDIGTAKARANDVSARRLAAHREEAASEFAGFEEMRDRARQIRLHTLARLENYLAEFADSVERLGGKVFFAGDAAEANGYVCDVATRAGVRSAVKVKSMVTEEIELNHALEQAGVTVVETDLGEFIVQLSGDRPSHIIAPVLHKTRQEIGRLFEDKLGVDIARRHLRPIFLAADMGISGANFGVASTGSIVTVTNEGNGRLSTTAPRIHVVVMGMERLVPGPGDLTVMLEVLARSGTGQRLSAYTNIVTGPRRPGDPDGPDELHVVILDNGRSRVLGSSASEILGCIRCGACLNVCPVYRTVGGHAYGGTYAGPVGSVLTPAMAEDGGWSDLPFASTLCGACRDACPIRIDIPGMLTALRSELIGESGFGWLRPGLSAYARAATNPTLWRAFLAAGSVFGRTVGRTGWVEKLPFHAGNWTERRDLPAPAAESFHAWWRHNRGT
jgi:L-lactate dehydrogenase complex protein LldF